LASDRESLRIVPLGPLLRGSDWRGPAAGQIRQLSKVFGTIRGMAGLAVLGLAAMLYTSQSRLGVVLLIIWVSAYNGIALFGFYRLSDAAIVNLARAVQVLDVSSFFLMLWVFGPTPPGALIACYVALMNVSVTFDGIAGALASCFLFVAGYAGFTAVRSALLSQPYPYGDVVLWSVVMVVIGISLASIQRVLVAREPDANDGRPSLVAVPALRLSPREQDVLKLVAEGFSNTMIANRLHLSENTVKGYVENLLVRLNARNRAEAVAAASRMNLL
jgi:DNA-binding CsgD family transcriptional regulator